MTDIVITGIGVIGALGIGKEAFWESIRQANSGIRKIGSFDTSSFRSNVGGTVEGFEPGRFIPSSAYRRMSRISRMAVAASVEALGDSGLILEGVDRDRIAVVMGTAYGSSSRVEEFYKTLLKDGPRGAQPFLFPETVPNAPASQIAMFHRITGPNTTFCQNEVSAENAISYARDVLMDGHADVALAGGAEELSAILYLCYDALGALSRIKVEGPGSINPLPGGGLILGEGAGVLVMEKRKSALLRGARIYGTLKSSATRGGFASLGHYEPSGESMSRSLSMAIEQAGITPHDIDQIHVSANCSGELDRMEHAQLKKFPGLRLEDLGVIPLKYLTGDFGGAGAIRAAAALLSLHHRVPLPTVSAETLKADPPRPPEWRIRSDTKPQAALVTTSTFGGGSSSLVFTSE